MESAEDAPDQEVVLKALCYHRVVVCPVVDRRCHRVFSAPSPPARLPSLQRGVSWSVSGCDGLSRVVVLITGEDSPGDPCQLVGESNRHKSRRPPFEKAPDPLLQWRSPTGITHHANCANEQKASDIAITLLGDPAEPLFAAGGVLSRRQTKPRAKWRPERKAFGSGTVAAMAVAVIGPIPGMVARRWRARFARCQCLILVSRTLIRRDSASMLSTTVTSADRAVVGTRRSVLSRTTAASWGALPISFATTMPNSDTRDPRRQQPRRRGLVDAADVEAEADHLDLGAAVAALAE